MLVIVVHQKKKRIFILHVNSAAVLSEKLQKRLGLFLLSVKMAERQPGSAIIFPVFTKLKILEQLVW